MMTIHTTRNNARTTQRGFTVIEIMVVVAIVGILAAIAYPSYQEQIAKSRRADAQRALIEAEQYMRRYFSAQDTFVGAVLPAGLAVSPRVAAPAAVMYNIQLSNLTATTFTLTATRAGVMASDRCGNLVVTHTGAKSLTGTAAGVSREDCFKAS